LSQAIASPAITAARRRPPIGDAVFAFAARFAGAFVLVLLGAIIIVLFLGGFAAFRAFGPAFLTSAAWDPVKEVFARATGIDVLDFNTTQARAALRRLGFEVRTVSPLGHRRRP